MLATLAAGLGVFWWRRRIEREDIERGIVKPGGTTAGPSRSGSARCPGSTWSSLILSTHAGAEDRGALAWVDIEELGRPASQH